MDEYSELILRLLPPREPNGKYQLEAVVDGLGFWTGGQIALPSDSLDDAASPTDYGRKLWALLTAGWCELSEIYSLALGKGDGKLRLRFMLDQTPELHSLKWEFLTPKGSRAPIGVDPVIPVSRFLALPTSSGSDTASSLKILLAIASPSNLKFPLADIKVDEEIGGFLDALERDIREGQVELTVLSGRTALSPVVSKRLKNLRCTVLQNQFTTVDNIARQLPKNHVLHLIAHGDFRNGRSIVTLENDRGESVAASPLPDPKLAEADPTTEDPSFLRKWSPPNLRLVFLQSCRSDPKSSAGLSAGLGPTFVKQGVPAVVAMSDFVGMEAARKFSAGFYRHLVRTGEVDEAANAGRRETYETANGDWGIPVLYSGLRSGQRLWRPDPLRSSIRDLADALKDSLAVTKPFPVEVTVFKNQEVARLELDSPTSYARVDAFETAKTELLSPVPTSNPVILVGGRGRAKSSLLVKLFVELATAPDSASAPSPILVKLSDCAGPTAAAAIANAWAKTLEGYRIQADTKLLERQLRTGAVYVLVDCQDELGGEQFDNSFTRIKQFLNAKNRFGLVAMDQAVFNPVSFADMTPTVLIIQDLRPATLKRYLDEYYSTLSADLLDNLSGPLSDLAGIPCLLSRILTLVDRGLIDAEPSRFFILDRIMNESLARNTDTPGFGSLAKASLQEMAWRLQRSPEPHLSVQDTYGFLIAARGSRDFQLDQFRSGLIHAELLVGTGPENVRFAYNSAHAYFTACYLNSLPPQDSRENLGEIVAGLRSAQRLRKWQEVLLLLSGQMARPDLLIAMLLELGFGEGDHLLLAARCIHEATSNENAVDPALISQVTDSIIWWSSPGSGLRPRSRRRAVRGLAYLLRQPSQIDSIVCHLVQLAIGNVSANPAAEFEPDYSPVRLDAMSLLFRNHEITLPHVKTALAKYPHLSEINEFVANWSKAEIGTLANHLNDHAADSQCCTQKALLASLAAFALMANGSPEAIECIVKRFLREPVNPDLHWMITDGLITLQASKAASLVSDAVKYRDKYSADLSCFVVYAIGRLGSTLTIGETLDEDNPIWQYLASNIKSENVTLKGRSLRASAEILSNSKHPEREKLRSICHDILIDQAAQHECLWGGRESRQLPSPDSAKLKKYAIEALEQIGDQTSLDVLRKFCLQRGNGKTVPAAEPLRKLSWDAAEKIRLRIPRDGNTKTKEHYVQPINTRH